MLMLSINQEENPDDTGRKVQSGLPHLPVEWHFDSSHLTVWLSIMSFLCDFITDIIASPIKGLQNPLSK